MLVHATFGKLRLVELNDDDGFCEAPATVIEIDALGKVGTSRLWLLGADDSDLVKKLIIRGFASLGAAYESSAATSAAVEGLLGDINRGYAAAHPCPDADAGDVSPVILGQGEYVRRWPK